MIMIPLSAHLIFFFPQFVPRSRVPVGKVLMKKTTNSLGRELAASDVAANFSFTHSPSVAFEGRQDDSQIGQVVDDLLDERLLMFVGVSEFSHRHVAQVFEPGQLGQVDFPQDFRLRRRHLADRFDRIPTVVADPLDLMETSGVV